MQENTTNLDELFTLPIGLKPIVRLDGKVLYGSENLNRSFLDAISTSSLISNAGVFEQLVRNKRIVPCFLTGGLTSFIFWKIFAPVHLKNVLGFYEKTTKKVYILLSNNFNFLAYTSNEWLCKLVMHECVHMLADNDASKFISEFEEMLIRYYSAYFKRLFGSEQPDNKILDIILFIFETLESNNTNIKGSDLKAYFTLLTETFTEGNKKENEEKANRLLSCLYLYLVNFEKFFGAKENFRDILYPLYLSYKDALNIKNLNTTCVQELFVPSEVIAISSEYSQYSTKVVSSLKDL